MIRVSPPDGRVRNSCFANSCILCWNVYKTPSAGVRRHQLPRLSAVFVRIVVEAREMFKVRDEVVRLRGQPSCRDIAQRLSVFHACVACTHAGGRFATAVVLWSRSAWFSRLTRLSSCRLDYTSRLSSVLCGPPGVLARNVADAAFA